MELKKEFLYLFVFFIVLFENCYGWISFYESYVLYVFQFNVSFYRAVYQCRAYGAAFGGDMPNGRTTGCLIPIEPRDACSSIIKPAIPANISTSCVSVFALIIRGNCSFAVKALNVQKASYKAAVIYNDVNDPPAETMMDDDEHHGLQVYIPSFLVNNHCGEELLSEYTIAKGYAVSIRTYWSDFDVLRYLVPFIAVVGICFLAMLISTVVKIIRDRRRRMRRRLTISNLKKLPIKRYKKFDTPETCPICLEDFVEGEKLRLLPCNHWYHVNCIDPWLTKNRKVCPVCKRRVDPNDNDSSDSEIEGEENERRPLLTPDRRSTENNYSSTTVAQLSPVSSPESEETPTTSTRLRSAEDNAAFVDFPPSSSGASSNNSNNLPIT